MREKSVLTLLGTRPEVIKLAPVILSLEGRLDAVRTINVASGQHVDLCYPFIEFFGLRVDFDLCPMPGSLTPKTLLRRMLGRLHSILTEQTPDLVLVQGDTTTALAGAIAGHQQGIAVAHIEAGLRSGNILSPFPEEMNRRWITRLAKYHFAVTARNRDALLAEGIRDDAIFVVGNPVVDALKMVLETGKPLRARELFAKIAGRKYIVLTTHRRESFGRVLREHLQALRRFVQQHDEIFLVFPVHPNPNVKVLAYQLLGNCPRILLTEPLPYPDFIQVLSGSWLVVSDSGGIQEEVPSLGKPLLVLRENTERPECIEAGLARLVGRRPGALLAMLEEAYRKNSWANSVSKTLNPFGGGDSGKRIANCISSLLQRQMEAAVSEESCLT